MGHFESSCTYPKPDLSAAPAPPDLVEAAAAQEQKRDPIKRLPVPPVPSAPCENKQPPAPRSCPERSASAQGPAGDKPPSQEAKDAHLSPGGFLTLYAQFPHSARIIVWKQKASAIETILHPTASQETAGGGFFFFFSFFLEKQSAMFIFLISERKPMGNAMPYSPLFSCHIIIMHYTKQNLLENPLV